MKGGLLLSGQMQRGLGERQSFKNTVPKPQKIDDKIV